MDVFFAIINVGFLLFVAFRLWRKEPAILKPFFWPALVVKGLAGIALGERRMAHVRRRRLDQLQVRQHTDSR